MKLHDNVVKPALTPSKTATSDTGSNREESDKTHTTNLIEQFECGVRWVIFPVLADGCRIL